MTRTEVHARRLLAELLKRRAPDGEIPIVSSSEIISACGLEPGSYGRAFGQAVSLLDVACLEANLPWIGRLVRFGNKADDATASWASWRPHMDDIIAAPQQRRWSASDIDRIHAHFPQVGARKWWGENESDHKMLLRKALAVAAESSIQRGGG